MAVAAKKLKVGDLVEIDGRQYDVISDKAGGVTLEPAITKTVDELYGGRPLTEEEFRRAVRLPPRDGEG